MGKKNKGGGGGGGDHQKDENGGGGGGGGGGNSNVVLKMDLHCPGCISKISSIISSYDGVDDVTFDRDAGKVTVIGSVDPAKLRDKLEAKLHQKIALVSPQPKGRGGEDGDNDGNCDDKKKQVVTTTTLKMNLHCDGCLHKIYKIVSKTKGYMEMSVEREKDHLMVTGIVDAKALADDLKKQMKRNVEIVPPKKEKGCGGGGDKKDAAGGGGEKKGGGEGNKNAGEMGFVHHGPCPCNYPYASQLWSDENANACSIL